MMVTITTVYVLFFLNAAGLWSKEMQKPYLYLIPQSPFKKLFFASLTSLLTPIADGIVVFLLTGILVKAPPLTAVSCFLMFISFGFLYTVFNILSERLFGQMANKGLILMLYALVLMFAAAPGGHPAGSSAGSAGLADGPAGISVEYRHQRSGLCFVQRNPEQRGAEGVTGRIPSVWNASGEKLDSRAFG